MYVLTNTNPRFAIYNEVTLLKRFEFSDKISVVVVDNKGDYRDRASEDIVRAIQIWYDTFKDSIAIDQYIIDTFGFQEWSYD